MGKAKGIGIFLFLSMIGFGILTILEGSFIAAWEIVNTQFSRLDKFPPILLVGLGALVIGILTGYFGKSVDKKAYWKT